MSDSTQTKDETPNTTSSTALMVNHFLFPAVTEDYRMTKGKFGYQLVANRRIPKGSQVLTESLEFLFSDVKDGDRLWLANHEEASKLAAASTVDCGNGNGVNSTSSIVPKYIPITRHMLLFSHGILQTRKESCEEVVLSSYLEVPGMMMNHSCDPSVIHGKDGEDIAARDLKVGDEITVDYAVGDYDEAPFEDCCCGAPNCRGKAMSFKDMNKADQERLWPQLMDATRAQYLEALGKGPKVREEEIVHPPRVPPTPTTPSTNSNGMKNRKVMRLVCPGPEMAETKIMVKKCITDENVDRFKIDSIHDYGLYATEDFAKGQMLYDFWSQNWPFGDEDIVIDMVFATPKQDKGDDKEGVVIRFDPRKCGAYRNANGQLAFSSWQLLAAHSCDPNVVYRNKEKYEDDNWQSVFAAKDIKKGDRLSVDWNCFIWDLDTSGIGSGEEDSVCHCGVPNCTGTKQGFKHLSSKAQQERIEMTWLHEASPDDNSTHHSYRALSPYVREAWKKLGCPGEHTQECFQ